MIFLMSYITLMCEWGFTMNVLKILANLFKYLHLMILNFERFVRIFREKSDLIKIDIN